MELETLTVVMAVIGMTLLYGAVTNRNPLDVVTLALQGKPIAGAAPISGSGEEPDKEGTLGPDTEPDVPGTSGTLAPGKGQLSGQAPQLGAIPPGAI